MKLAHINNGKIKAICPDGKGRVVLSNGDTVSPPVSGYVNGPDKVVPVIERTIDNSTQSNTMQSRWTLVEESQVVMGTTISDLPDADLSRRLRQKRNDMLSETDWVVTKAVEQNSADGLGIQVPVVWIQYRQALRDITKQAGFPHNVTWPQEP